jgi:hypothetical protein
MAGKTVYLVTEKKKFMPLANSFRERQRRDMFIDYFEIFIQAPEERHLTVVCCRSSGARE